MLSFSNLFDALPDLSDSYPNYIRRLTNRAQWRPSFDACRISRADTDQHVAVIEVYIREHFDFPPGFHNAHLFPRQRWIHLYYAIYPRGGSVCLTAPRRDWSGAESAYKQAVDDWSVCVYERLAEEMSAKARIQERAKTLYEELAAKMWHPDRVAALLDEGGWDLMDAADERLSILKPSALKAIKV